MAFEQLQKWKYLNKILIIIIIIIFWFATITLQIQEKIISFVK